MNLVSKVGAAHGAKAAPAQNVSRPGPAILSRGFRPFFLGAGLWAVIGIALWPLAFSGMISVPTAFWLIDWHAHEMIFGYTEAVIAGFLFTAIPNWTGRLPVSGTPLAALAALWIAGRTAIFFSAAIGRLAAAVIDVSFLLVFAAMIAREVIAGKNGRNAKVVWLVALLAGLNVAFHVEDARTGFADYSARGSLAVIVMLILLVGGRVTPSFTNNWLAKTGAKERPAPFGKPDLAALAVSAVALASWAATPHLAATGVVTLAAGAANLWRLSRWRGAAARHDPLVLVLHIGYLFATLGFFVACAHALLPETIPHAAAVHVWAVGAIGMMTLAVMSRATLGHTGRELKASKGTVFAYACVASAAVGRFAMALLPDHFWGLFAITAGCWILAFAAFVAIYVPMLAGRAGKPLARPPQGDRLRRQ